MILEVLEPEEEILVANIGRKQSAGARTHPGNWQRDHLEETELSEVSNKPKEPTEKHVLMWDCGREIQRPNRTRLLEYERAGHPQDCPGLWEWRGWGAFYSLKE